MIAIYKKDPDLTRKVLNELDNYLFEELTKEEEKDEFNHIVENSQINIDKESLAKIKTNFLVFNQFINGDKIDIEEIAKKCIPSLNSTLVRMLQEASRQDIDSLENVAECLGFIIQKHEIVEYFDAIINGDTDLAKIGKRIGVYDENIKVFKSLFMFVISTSKLFIKIKPKFEQTKDLLNSNEYQIRYEQELIKIKEDLEKWLDVFIDKGCIGIRGIGGIYNFK